VVGEGCTICTCHLFSDVMQLAVFVVVVMVGVLFLQNLTVMFHIICILLISVVQILYFQFP